MEILSPDKGVEKKVLRGRGDGWAQTAAGGSGINWRQEKKINRERMVRKL